MSDPKDDDFDIDVSAFEGLERPTIDMPGPLAISHEELQRALKEGQRKIKENDDRRKGRIAPNARTGKCMVCPGDLTEKFHRQFDATSGAMIIGPGSAYQFYWASSGLYCMECGLKYQHAPKQKNVNTETTND